MLKKYLPFGVTVVAFFAVTSFSQQYLASAANTPAQAAAPAARPVHSSSTANGVSAIIPAKMTALVFDRSGMDRASVHLQILQQSNARFEDVKQVKKIVNEEKPVIKARTNT